MGNTVRFKAEMDDGVSKKLNGISAAFDKIGGKGSGASLFGNVGAAAISKGFGLIDTAASALVGTLGDSMQAARDDQASIANLDAALKANIPGWDGNREAIEKVISARMRLGFSDEEQRASLALLLAAGDDVTTGLQLQTTAMDLARLKHISLEEATTALIKTEDGHYRVLQGLGIVLGDNATAQDAVNAVQAVANGQASAFADTDGGKQLARQIQINEALEKIGYVLLPIVATAMDALAAVAVPALELVAGALRIVFGLVGNVIDAIRTAIDALGHLGDVAQQIGQAALPDNVRQMLHDQGVQGYATGGVVPGEIGAAQLAIVHGGETVTPPGQGGGQGFTIQGVSREEIEAIADRSLYVKLQRAAPTLARS
jgi:hypothetical protein